MEVKINSSSCTSPADALVVASVLLFVVAPVLLFVVAPILLLVVPSVLLFVVAPVLMFVVTPVLLMVVPLVLFSMIISMISCSMNFRHTFWASFNMSKRFYSLCLRARGPLIKSVYLIDLFKSPLAHKQRP